MNTQQLNDNNNKPIVVAVVGIIGAGKSTIIRRLQETTVLPDTLKRSFGNWKPKIVYVREKSAEWEKHGDLKRFYEDPDTHAYWFQTMVLNSYVDAMDEALQEKPDVVVVERTMMCQRIFWEIQVELGRTQDHQDRAYRGNDLKGRSGIWSKWERLTVRPDIILYAKTSEIETTLDRVKSRGREGENASPEDEKVGEKETGGVTLSYEQQLKAAHDKQYASYKCRPFGMPSIECIHVSTDEPLHEDDKVLKRIVVDPIQRATNRILADRKQKQAHFNQEAINEQVRLAVAYNSVDVPDVVENAALAVEHEKEKNKTWVQVLMQRN